MNMQRREFCAGVAALLTAGTPAQTAEPMQTAPARGLYRRATGDFIAIAPFQEFGEGLFLFDYPRLRAGKLVPGHGDLGVSSTFDGSGATVGHLSVTADMVVLGGHTFAPVPLSRVALVASNGAVALRGEIVRLSNTRPKAAILLVYGSGDAPRQALDFWAFWFAAKNFAVVVYDKRGSGASAGDWRTASFHDLAQDATAIAAEARNRLPGLKLGLWGASQAGWIMPQIAAVGAVDFVVMHAGGVETPRDQSLDLVQAELRAYGFDEVEIARARAYYALDIDVSCGRAPYADIEKAYKEASAAKAQWLLAPPLPADAPDRNFMKRIAGFDSAPFWQHMSVPLLALFGGKDVIVPPEKNAPLLRQWLPADVPVDIVTIPQMNHLGFVGHTGVRAEYVTCTSIVPEYFPRIEAFLAGHLGGR